MAVAFKLTIWIPVEQAYCASVELLGSRIDKSIRSHGEGGTRVPFQPRIRYCLVPVKMEAEAQPRTKALSEVREEINERR